VTAERDISSVLAADVGSTWTHVCLLDRVEGVYRLMARAEEPTRQGGGAQALRAVIAAVRRIERIAQRALLDSLDEPVTPESPAGDGVDAIVACSSAAPPLNCALIGLTADVSLPSAARACAGAMARVSTAIALGQRPGATRLAQLLPLEAAPPDVIVLTGGYDNGPIAPLRAAAEMLSALFSDAPAERRPVIVFAGNQEARRPVAQALGPAFELAVVDNVRPNEATESPLELQRELWRLYRERQLAAVSGMAALERWCAAPVQSTSDALQVALRYLARRNELPAGVLGYDVGGNATTLTATGQQGLHAFVSADLGVAAGLSGLLSDDSLQRVAQWLPYDTTSAELSAQLENARLWPGGVPQTLDDLLMLHGAARVALRQTYDEWRAQLPQGDDNSPSFRLIAARGGALAHCPQDGLSALLTLDALQPVGLARLVVDWASLWPQLGALAAVAPLAASQVFDRDSVRELGAALCPIGQLRAGERALRLTIESPGRATRALEVAFGQVARASLAPDETAIVKVWPHPRLDIGLGEPGRPAQARVQGGTLGLIIDARGRPLRLPDDDRDRVRWQQRWIKSLCAP
jgi:hypothetical protein